jgi:hypothetical protein
MAASHTTSISCCFHLRWHLERLLAAAAGFTAAAATASQAALAVLY